MNSYLYPLLCDAILLECLLPQICSTLSSEYVTMHAACYGCISGSCLNAADVVFAIDNSATLGPDKYQQLLAFIAAVVRTLDVNGTSGKIRIGAVTFSDNPVLQFNLTTYQTREQISQRILNLPYSGYSTDTAGALTVMMNMFR